jgi:hypothetical protein
MKSLRVAGNLFDDHSVDQKIGKLRRGLGAPAGM